MPSIAKQTAYRHHDDCEKKVYVHWINRNLFRKESLENYLPINPDGEEIFDRISDGIIFCEIISEIFPNSIDVKVLMIGSQTTKENKIKNLQLALETSRSFGCQIDNLPVNDIFSGVRQSVLEFFWQIFYIGLVVSINHENFPEIEIFREVHETKNIMHEMKPEEILARYVNQQIRHYNPGCKAVRSFKDNFSDGYVYALLLDSIAQQQIINLKNPTSLIFKEKNEKARNVMLWENFDSLKMQGFITEELMNQQCSDTALSKMHLLTMAMFFHRYGIDPSIFKSEKREKIRKESNIEKLCRCFLNFISVQSIVTNLRNDCKDGLIFAQVMQLFVPEVFKKDVFIEEFNEEQIPSKRIHNSAIIINRFQQFFNVAIRDFHAEYIQSGREKVVCGIVYNIMLHWAINVDPEAEKQMFNEKELMEWVNSISKDYKVHSFRDSRIQDKNILAKVIDATFPKSVDWDHVKELTDRKCRAIYCVSLARREGYPMFIHPTMIASGDYRSLTLAFAILRYRNPKMRKNVCLD